MNIFYLSTDSLECAQMHNNSHCSKMILEYTQLLSTAHRVLDGDIFIDNSSGRRIKRWKLNDPEMDLNLYKATHINHPSSVWVRESQANYVFLRDLLYYLNEEFYYRFGKHHKSFINVFRYLQTPPKYIPIKDFTEPTPAMPDKYKVPNNSLESYRNYYIGDKQHLAKWTNREIPKWFKKS